MISFQMSNRGPRAKVIGVIAGILGFVIILTWSFGSKVDPLPVMPFPRERDAMEVMLNVIIISLPAMAISGLLALTLRYIRHLIYKAFILVGAFFAILMFQAGAPILETLWFTLLLWLYMCMIVFSAFFSIIGFLPDYIDKIIYVLYGIIFGSFLGINSPTYSLILFILIYSIYDVFFSKLIDLLILSGRIHDEIMPITLCIDDIKIGIGDIIFYSIISSHAQHHFSIGLALISMIFILIGVVICISIAERGKVYPGLPLPLSLGIIPIIYRLMII